MREIKFKAKGKYSQRWEYFDVTQEIKFIILETLSQFTGFKDIDGNDAYENDTIEQNDSITFRDGCFFSGHIPLALVIEHRKITGNIHD